MTDEYERASGYEQHERETVVRTHAAMMATLKTAEDCKHCGVELQDHRKPWASCIYCATREEQRLRSFRR